VKNDNDPEFDPARIGIAVRRLADGAGKLLGSLMAVDLFAIVLLTVVDVVGRYFINRPILGASEMIEFMLAILVFGSLPLASVAGEHVVIDLVDFALTRRAKRIQRIFVQAASAVLLALIGWRLWARAAELGLHGDVTQSLRLPLAPLGYLMSAMSWVSAVLVLALLLRGQPPREARDGPRGSPG
jgi:TRAP-type C4-dicarboxylate transport system permease small subunit